jgi:16S rRNA G966 N2-methylase RsmD
LAKGLKASVADLLPDVGGLSYFKLASSTGIDSFEELDRLTTSVDVELMALVRDHPYMDISKRRKECRYIIDAILHEAGLDLATLLQITRDADLLQRLLQTTPSPDVVVDVSADLQRMVFSYDTHELPVQRPQLLWDCQCKTLKATVPVSKCPIHSKAEGAEVEERFSHGLVLIRFDGLEILWKSRPALWPPSIDSLFMARNLRQSHALNSFGETVLDLGSGTGFLGLYAASKSRGCKGIYLADWLLAPVLYGAVNYWRNRSAFGEAEVFPLLGLDRSWFPSRFKVPESFDLLLCNPPYLPLIRGHEDLAQKSTVMGTELLESVIRSGCDMSTRAIVQYSALAAPEASAAACAAGVALRPIGKSRLVPFRVKHTFSSPSYIDALIADRGLKLMPRRRHPLWHSLRSHEVVR